MNDEVSLDAKAIVAAILAVARMDRVGTDHAATTPQAFVDEYMKILDCLQNPHRAEG